MSCGRLLSRQVDDMKGAIIGKAHLGTLPAPMPVITPLCPHFMTRIRGELARFAIVKSKGRWIKHSSAHEFTRLPWA